ncbi:MAG: hypothetical protein HFG38_10395 [Eubacterium sp.]|mgnify:FL=1|nr:hypothetical protein [Eubacterium sp.]
MRRRYTIVCLLLCAMVLLGGMCYGSYRYAQQVTEERLQYREEKTDQTEQTSGGTQQKINSDTKYIVEIYNGDSEENVREVRTMPSEYAGMTRKELEAYLDSFMSDLPEEEVDAGLIDIKLVSFSKDELVIRKTYQEDKGYILRLVDGEVTIFSRANEDEFEKTGISQDSLTEEDIRALQEGYSVDSEKDLYSILENFSS